MMPTLLDPNNKNGNWRAWFLNISIAIISGLIFLGVTNLERQIGNIATQLTNVIDHNYKQDLCLKELEIKMEQLEKERSGKK